MAAPPMSERSEKDAQRGGRARSRCARGRRGRGRSCAARGPSASATLEEESDQAETHLVEVVLVGVELGAVVGPLDAAVLDGCRDEDEPGGLDGLELDGEEGVAALVVIVLEVVLRAVVTAVLGGREVEVGLQGEDESALGRGRRNKVSAGRTRGP